MKFSCSTFQLPPTAHEVISRLFTFRILEVPSRRMLPLIVTRSSNVYLANPKNERMPKPVFALLATGGKLAPDPAPCPVSLKRGSRLYTVKPNALCQFLSTSNHPETSSS